MKAWESEGRRVSVGLRGRKRRRRRRRVPPETQKRKKKATEERREGLMRGLEGGGLERERCRVRGSELSVYIYIFVKITINYPIIYS